MRAERIVGCLRALGYAIIPGVRRALFFIGFFSILQSQISSAQTPTIGLVVNGLTNPNNQFFLPFGASAQVAITSSIPNAVIYYTTNGSDVQFDSPIYSGPFTTTNATEVQAFATDTNFDEFSPAITGLIQFVPTRILTDATPGGGTVSLSPPGGVYGSGTVVTLNATPAAGWTFSNWSGGVSGTNPVLAVTLTNNLTVAAVFVTPVAMSAGPANFGTVVGSPPGGVYAYGTSVGISAVPSPGDYFFRWANVNLGSASPIMITVTNANINGSALFASLTGTNVSLALVDNGPGAVQAAPSANYYPFGSTVTVTATPESGDSFLDWSGGATGSTNPLTLTLTSNTVVTANFSTVFPQILVQPFSHTLVAGSNITLNVSAIGTLPLTYQWWFNVTNLLPGQTSSNLTLLNVQASTVGSYSVVVTNPVGVVTSSVSRISVMTPTIHWTGAADGQSWNNPGNWNTGVLPNSFDSVFIGNNSGTITNVPGGLMLNNLLCQRALSITGSLMVTGAVDVVSNLYLAPGITLTVSGTNAAFIGEGSTTADGVNMYAGLGGLISLPGLTNINGANITDAALEAGPGSVLDLSSVRSMIGGANYELNVYADAGALVNLSGVTNIDGSGYGNSFYAKSTNSVINLSSLLVFTGLGTFEAGNGGAILATNLSYIQGISLYLDDNNSTLALTGLTTILANGTITIQAGAGAALNLSSVRFMQGAIFNYELNVYADAGALVDLSGVTNVLGGTKGAFFYATATNSVINLSSLLTFTQLGAFEAGNGGAILATNLNYIQGISLSLDDSSSTLALGSLNTISNSSGDPTVYLTAYPGAVLNLSSVRQMFAANNSGIVVNPQVGALVDLSGLTNISSGGVFFYASFTNAAVNLGSLQTFSGSASLLQATNGGAIWATNLTYIQGVSLGVDANSTLALGSLNTISNSGGDPTVYLTAYSGAVLNLSSVRQMSAANNGGMVVNPQAGALVNLSGLTNIATGNVYFYADFANSVINLSSLLVFDGPGTLSQSGGGLIETNAATVYQNVSMSLGAAILIQPQNVTALYGSNATFSVVADGASPLAYQWYFDQTNLIHGATGTTLSLFNLNYGQIGTYAVVVSNSLGVVTSTPASFNLTGTISLGVVTNGPGTVQVTPSEQLYPFDSVVALTATPGPGDNFLGWSGEATGSTNPLTLTLTSNTVITANFGTTAPQIVVQPFSHTVVAGSSVTLNVSAIGTLPLNYQWLDGTNVLTGQTNSSLTLLNAQTSTVGKYTVVVSNFVGVVTSSVARVSVMQPTIFWTGAGDGTSWNNSSNWNTGVLPASSDSILIAGTNGTINATTSLTLSNLLCQRSLTLNGSLNVSGAVDIGQSFSIPSGNSILVNGSNAVLIAEGSTTANAVNIYANSVGFISFPGLITLTGPGAMDAENGGVILSPNLNYIAGIDLYLDSSSTLALNNLASISGIGNIGIPGNYTLEAGPGAVLNLSSVRNMSGSYGNYSGVSSVTADAGALVNLSGVTNIGGSTGIGINAIATNSVINLNSLLVFNGLGMMSAQNGGAILATNLNSITAVNLYVDASSTLALNNLASISGIGNIGSPGNYTLEAGPGAVLNLSSVRNMSGSYGNYSGESSVTADAGALVNLSGVTNIGGSTSVNFFANSTNGVINLSGLLAFTQYGELEAQNGGAILATNLNYIQGVNLYVDGSSTLALTGLTNINGGSSIGSTITAAPGAVLSLSSVRQIEGPVTDGSLSVYADAGALVNLSGVTNIVGNVTVNFYADFTNSVINLSGLLMFNGPGTLSQENGGLIILNTNLASQNVSQQLAPYILSAPQRAYAVGSGLTVTYSMAVSATSPAFYQWYSNNIPIPGGTNSMLVLNSVQPSWAGSGYSVAISNAYGSATSPATLLTVPTESLATTVNGSGQVQVSPVVPNYYLGQTFTLNAVPGLYYAFAQWSDGVRTNPRAIVINSNNVYTANFTNTVPLDTYTNNGVTFQLPAGTPLVLVDGQYSPSNSFAIPATNTIQVSLQTSFPNGYIFYTLDGSDPDFNSTYYTAPFGVTNSVLVRAIAYSYDGTIFQEADPVTIQVVTICDLTNTTPGGGSVAFNPTGGVYLSNAVVTATATASNGWSFMGWQGVSTSTNNPVMVTISNSTNLTAVFGTTISTTTNGAGANVALWPPQGPYAYGSTVRLVGVPPAGKYFSRWFNIFLGPTNNPYNLVVTNATPLAGAFFSNLGATNFTLTTLLNGFGTVTCNPTANFYPSNTAVQLTAVPDNGYLFIGWNGNASGTQNPLTVVMTSNLVITANFATTLPPTNPPPSVAITNPVTGAIFTAPVNISIGATASDADGTVAQVALLNGTTLLRTATNSPYNFVWTNAPVGTNVLSAVATDNFGLSSTSAPVSVVVQPEPPVFQFGSANYSVNESNGAVTVTVLNNGQLGGLVNFMTADGTAFGGSGYSGSYTMAQGSLSFANGQQSTNITIGVIDNYLSGSDIQFSVELFSPSAGTLGTPAITTVTIHENDVGGVTNSLTTVVSPTNQPSTSGALTMFLTPSEANGQWRFPWEQGWHPGGYTETGLQAGNYPVEFQDVPNYLAYPSTVTYIVTNNGTTIVTNQYLPTYTSLGANSTGSLTVDITPNAPPNSGWRFIGEIPWRLPNTSATGLLPDTYFIQYEPVGGYASPASQAVQMFGGQAVVVTANYLSPASVPNGSLTPSQITPSLITDIRDFPYGFNGQLYTDVGYGSGVAVRETVVLTAAHMVFNDATLSYVNQAYWSFQEEAGTFSPEPQAARGWYVLSGYAEQRTSDIQIYHYGIDESSPQSRDLDVAALYFLSPAARDGYGGYLSSDVSPNPWLTGSSLKMLVGYPVDGSEYGQTVVPGTMYGTAAQPNALTLSTDEVYSASWFLSYPGNSGGPLYVQFNNYYYPAAVYLGQDNSGVSVVRAINSDVVNLINLAASEGDGGTNFTGGGVLTLIAGQASLNNPAYVQVNLGPAVAVSAGAGWRLQGDPVFGTVSNYTRAVTSSNAMVQFAPVNGWSAPTNQSVELTAGQLNIIQAMYMVSNPVLVAGAGLELGITGTTGTVYEIDSRTSLTSGSWVPVSTNTITSSGFNPVMPLNAGHQSTIFYRAIWLP